MEIEQIRAIRNNPAMKLKPSPYLRESFVEADGSSVRVDVRNYQSQGIMNMLQVPRMVLSDDTGLGKAQPLTSRVMTPTGWRTMGELRPGDRVIGSDGVPTKVIGVFPQGERPVYKVTMTDGSSTECCDEHLWTVRSGNTRRSGDGWRTLSLREIMDGGLLRQRGSTGRRWSIPTVEPVLFRERDLTVDPYLLGVLLGDGSMPSHIHVCNGDPKLFDLVTSRLPPGYRLGKYKPDGYSRPILMPEGTKSGTRSPLKAALKDLGLLGKNWTNKFIPSAYLHSSVRQRTDLLRGLMDTDGYVSKDGSVTQFYSSNGGLVRGFVELVQSLGGVARVVSKTPVLRGKSRAKNGRLAYIVTVSLPNQIVPFCLPRKVARWRPRTKYMPTRYIDRADFVGIKECVCIRVEAPDSLYVTDDYIVTHNTLQTLCAIGYVWMMEPEYVPIVVTRKSSLYQWDDEIKKFMTNMSAVVVDGEPFERNNVYKEFFGGWDASRKKLLVMTYDTYLKDFEQSVVRDRTAPTTKAGKAALKVAREALKVAREALKEKKKAFEPRKAAFKERFDGRNDVVKSYLVERLKPADEGAQPPKAPSGWSPEDEEFIVAAVSERFVVQTAQAAVDAARDLVEPPIMVDGIESRLQELLKAHPDVKLMLVMDEAHVIKNHQGKIHDAMGKTARLCERVIAMTATPVKNRLMEFFSLFRVVCPHLFPRITHFQRDYCIVKMQSIGRNRQVPIIVGHSKDQIERFVAAIEPYYLSRRKYDVAKELPELITREVVCVLSPEQVDLYEMAELEAEEAKAEADPDEPNAHAMKCMTLIQQASNAPQLISNEEGVPFEGESSKLEAIVELLQGAPDSKFLIFSRFKQMIDLVDRRLKKEKIRFVRITGDERAKERLANRDTFQDPASDVNVMLITTAGTESLNLQATEYIICIDSPWSWGDYVQLTGRGVRIGSKNLTVIMIHLIAMLPGGRETIDHHVVKTLRAKRKLADAVSGEALKGGLEFAEEDMVKEVMEMVRRARASGKTAGVRESVRTRIQSSGRTAKKKKAASAASPFLSLDGEPEAPPPASRKPSPENGELGLYVDMADI